MPRSKECEQTCKNVYDRGFNIYMLINRMKKELKLRVLIPDEVIIAVCDQYMKYEKSIKKQYPWFVKVFAEQSRIYFANRTVAESNQNKDAPMPQRMKQILKNL